MTIREGYGFNSFPAYGMGPGLVYDPGGMSGLSEFKLHRLFADNAYFSSPTNELAVQYSFHSSWKLDNDFELRKAAGIGMIWTTGGRFYEQTGIGDRAKSSPINDADDPKDLRSWARIADLKRQIALRYADDTAGKEDECTPYRPGNYKDNEPLVNRGEIAIIEGTNEYDFLWHGGRVLTPEDHAYEFWASHKAIRSVSQTMGHMPGAHLGIKSDSGIVGTIERFLSELNRIAYAEGEIMPTDFYLNFHWYMRDDAETHGISPEEAGAWEIGRQVDDLCDSYGLLGWYCTEVGWATDDLKQSAPIQEGFTQGQSQGLLMNRLMLIWGSLPHFRGCTFWMCRDDYDTAHFAKCGINTKSWIPKEARGEADDFLDKYGAASVVVGSYYFNSGIHSVSLDDGHTMFWTDGSVIEDVTPEPTRLDSIPPEPPIDPPIEPPIEPPTTTSYTVDIPAQQIVVTVKPNE